MYFSYQNTYRIILKKKKNKLQIGNMFCILFLINHVVHMDNVTIFAFGLTGAGKSALGNAFLQKYDVFQASSGTDSCTMELSMNNSYVNGFMRYYIDTIGLDSTDDNDEQNMEKMIKSLNELNVGINAFFLVISIHDPRITPTIRNMIATLNNFFRDSNCWKKAGIIFTKCNFDDDELPSKIVSAERYRENIKKYIKTLSNCKDMDIDLPCFYVNCLKWETENKTKQQLENVFQFAKQFTPNIHQFQYAPLSIKDSQDPRKIQSLIYKIRKPEQKSIEIFAFGKNRVFTLDENGKVVIPIKITLTQLYEYRLNWDPVENVENIFLPVSANYDFEKMVIFPIVNNQNLVTFIDHRKRSYWYSRVRRKTSRYTQKLVIELGDGFVFKDSNKSRYELNSPDIDNIYTMDPKCPAYEKRESTKVPSFLDITLN